MPIPIWVWVVSVVGVIAAGIGLGYLIIYLFWRIERYFFPEIAVPKKIEPEIKVEEPVPVPSERNRLVKFTYILKSKFSHPFEKANTIVCWDLALENRDEVRDALGEQMKLRVIKPKSETERIRYTLMDESGHRTIQVILGKEYLKRETNLDFDKMKAFR